MNVKNKLIAGLGTILLISSLMGGVGIWNTMRSSRFIDDIADSARGTLQLANSQNALWQLLYSIQQFILYTDKGARDKIVADDAKWYKEIDDNLVAFKAGQRSPEELTSLTKLQDVFKRFREARPHWFKLYFEWKLDEAGEWRSKTLQPLADGTIAELSALITLQQNIANAQEATAVAQLAQLRFMLIALVILTIAALLLLGYATIGSISTPLNKALGLANRVAAGDLTAHIETTSNDEFGSLLSALGSMNENLTRMVQDIRSGADSIRNAAEEVATGNSNLSQRTEEQAATLEETASSMEELTSTVRQNTQSADNANALAKDAHQVAVQGGSVVGAVVITMNEIQESSKKIGNIISVIDGIAFQTNILALNAAVEAARAGEQGRGFAVVAGEVRALAQRSAEAAREIKTLIGNSVQKVETGTRQVENAGKTMKEIVASVEKVTAIIDQISLASREQASGIEQVNKAIGEMDQVVQQNAAVVEQATAAAESMQANAQQLYQAVSVFKLAAVETEKPAAGTDYRGVNAATASKLLPTPRFTPTRRSLGIAKNGQGNYAAKEVPPKTEDGDWKAF